MSITAVVFRPHLSARRRLGAIFKYFCLAVSAFAILILAILVVRVFEEGWPVVTKNFLTAFPSVLFPERAGIRSALYGTIWLVVMTGLFAVPVGAGAAIYLEEYAGKGRLFRFIELNIANLAGVPSIVYGILGLSVFVRWLSLGRSVIAGALTLSLMILPVVIIAGREALRAVPQSIRAAAYAVGATRWQTVRAHVLPAALPGIMTGVILAISRAIGEAAPLLLLGAAAYIDFVPAGPMDDFTAIPIQIFQWSESTQPEFIHLAAAAIIVLMAILVPINGLAIGVRAWQQRKKVS